MEEYGWEKLTPAFMAILFVVILTEMTCKFPSAECLETIPSDPPSRNWSERFTETQRWSTLAAANATLSAVSTISPSPSPEPVDFDDWDNRIGI